MMRKTIISIILMMISMSAMAQALLHGMVLEYKGSETKKPLGGVELVIRMREQRHQPTMAVLHFLSGRNREVMLLR